MLIFLLSSCVTEKDTVDMIPLYVGVDVISENNTNMSLTRKLKSNLFTETIPLPDMDRIDAKYFAKPNEVVFIKVYLVNPDNQVILRLTIEGITYQAFQFEEGSHSELLIIRYQVSDQSGMHDLLIEEIKYIESKTNLTKDVRFESDPSIKIAVSYKEHMKAIVSEVLISHKQLDVEVTIEDPSELSKTYQRLPMFYLFDGIKIVYAKSLVVGNNLITYKDIVPNTLYTYAIVGVYDFLDGSGNVSKVLEQKTIQSKDAIKINDMTLTQTSISFEIISFETSGLIEITSISLLKGETIVSSLTQMEAIVFDDLLSNTSYEIVISYRFIQTDVRHFNTFIISETVNTLPKDIPLVDVQIDHVTSNAFEIVIDVIDKDNIYTLSSIDIYQGQTFIQSLNILSQLSVTNLLTNTSYDVYITYTYDLNDGTVINERIKSIQTKTLPKTIEVTSVEVLNNQTIAVNDLISLKISYNNFDNVVIDAFEIGGINYEVSLFLGINQALIIYSGFSDGGFKDIELTGYRIGNTRYLLKEEAFVTVEILNALSVSHIYNDFHNVITTDKTNVIQFDLSNDNAYEIYSIEITIDGVKYVYSSLEIIVSNDGKKITIPYDAPVIISTSAHVSDLKQTVVVLQKITYGRNQQSLITYDPTDSKNQLHPRVLRLYTLEFSEIMDIDTVEGFLEIQSGNIYRLTKDLDFKDIDIALMRFSGVLLGNHHTISNVSMTRYNESEVGLFSYVSGVIKDLTLNNFSLTQFNTTQSASIGSLAAYIGAGYVSNITLIGQHTLITTHNGDSYNSGCLAGISMASLSHIFIDGNCSIGVSTPERKISRMRMGGVVGILYGGIDSSEVKGILTIDMNRIHMGDRSYIGGIVGRSASLISNTLFSGQLHIRETQSIGDFAIYYAGIVGLSNNIDHLNMRFNIVTGFITLDLKGDQTAQLLGGIMGNLSFKDVKQTHIFMGNVTIKGNVNTIDYLGSQDVIGSAYIYDISKIYVNDILLDIRFGQTTVEQLNLKSFYEGIGFDTHIWNVDNVDVSNGIYPTLIRPNTSN
jgi:hypothetical protein